MKKIEAMELAEEKSNLIIEYINQILSDEEKVNAGMKFKTVKVDNQNMIVLDIYVPETNYKRSAGLVITNDHINVLFEQLLNDLLKFLPSDQVAVSRFISKRSNEGAFDGVNVCNSSGSKVSINMYGTPKELIENYNGKIDEFLNNQNIQATKVR